MDSNDKWNIRDNAKMDIYTVQYDKEFISEIINQYFRTHKEWKIELIDYCFGNELSIENVHY